MVSLLNNTALGAILGLMQKCCAAAKSSKHADEATTDEGGSARDAQQCAFVLRKLIALLASHGMAKQPDMLLPLMDTLAEAARSSCATGMHSCLVMPSAV